MNQTAVDRHGAGGPGDHGTITPIAAPASEQPRLKVVLVLKTSQGALFTLPHVDELRSRGHEVIAVLPPRQGNLRTALTERGVTVVDSPFDFRFRVGFSTAAGLYRLRRRLRELDPDALHYHLYASALATRLASLGLGVPRVHMVAGPLYLDSPLIRAVERRLVRLDTVTIVASEFTARRYRELGRTAARSRVIPYGADLSYFRSADPGVRERVRDELGIAEDTFVAVMVALVYAPKRLVHPGRGIKGHDVLLTAWRQFHAIHPDSHLLLVGGGFTEAGERHRQELIARFSVDDPACAVTWLDTVDDVRPYYAAADVSVSPSLSEEHGAAREAGALGVPSIVSDAGALPETVDARSGWVVPRDDPAALVAALRKAYVEHGRGELAGRGVYARELASRRFDDARARAAVADVIEQAGARDPHRSAPRSRVVSIFTDTRFGRRPDGRWTALDPASRCRKWNRYAGEGDRTRVIARADQRPIADSTAITDEVTLVPLPYYVGMRGLARKLIPLTVSVWRAVASADTVVLRVPGVIGSIAAIACRLLRRSYTVEIVGDPGDVLRAGVLGTTGRRLATLAEAQMRWLVRHAAASLYVTGRTLQDRYPCRPGTPTVSVSNVVLEPSALAAQGRNWQPAPFHIVTIGSQENHYKGHDDLLRAVRELVDRGLDVTATIVGGGRIHHELVELSEALGLAERVRFAGVVDDRARLVDCLDSASLFVLPSRTEGMPRALIEAMARALPAIGTDVGGIPELLPPDCLVPADDHHALAKAMEKLLSDPEAWETRSRANLEAAHAFEEAALQEKFSTWLGRVPPARRGRNGRRRP